MNEVKEFEITLSDELEAALAEDPDMTKALQSLKATLHQAQHGVLTGQYANLDDALEILTGTRPQAFDLDGNEIETGYGGEIESIEFVKMEVKDGDDD